MNKRYTLEFADGTKTWVVAISASVARKSWQAYLAGFTGGDLHPELTNVRLSSDQRGA